VYFKRLSIDEVNRCVKRCGWLTIYIMGLVEFVAAGIDAGGMFMR